MIQTLAAALATGALLAPVPVAVPTQLKPTIISRYCQTEDASAPADRAGCLWDATKRGNGLGWSFVALPRDRWVPVLRVPARLDAGHALAVRYETQWLTSDNAVMATIVYGRSVVMGRSWMPWGNL